MHKRIKNVRIIDHNPLQVPPAVSLVAAAEAVGQLEMISSCPETQQRRGVRVLTDVPAKATSRTAAAQFVAATIETKKYCND